jgi:diguanylate cyclase (GGDEF)-like protein
MQQISANIKSIEALKEFLWRDTTQHAALTAQSILVQIFVGSSFNCQDWVKRLIEATKTALPNAVIVGSSSAGEITQGRVSQESTHFSITFFQSSELFPLVLECLPGVETEVGHRLAESFKQVPHLQGILLLAMPTRMNCALILNGINERLPNVQVFGGGAADDLADKLPLVFCDNQFCQQAIVAVALAGPDLHINIRKLFGWKAFGLRMLLTDVENFTIHTIDGNNALEVYGKYLGIESKDDDLYLLEFPLLINRHGTVLARNPVCGGLDGSVSLIADIYEGEVARLGYLDIDGVLKKIPGLLKELSTFAPETIYIYSCVCRYYALQQEVEFETLPFQTVAPVSGFYTAGEFCRIGSRLHLLNSSQVIVAMREGEAAASATVSPEYTFDMEHQRFRHLRITSRLFHFITTLTEELEEANHKLQFLADRDSLTGTLNRRVMSVNLKTEISRSKRYRRPMTIILLDLDHFKLLNDTYGHAAGDQVLKAFVDRVRRTVRVSDTLYRYGGEEFLLLLPETPAETACEVAEKIRLAVESMLVEFREKKINHITVSQGIASYPQHGDSVPALIHAADTALYQAKDQGRNRSRIAPV